MNQRPHTLLEVTLEVEGGRWSFDEALRNFLHQYQADGCPLSAIADEPRHLQLKSREGSLQDAILGALAEHLCALRQVEAPDWCHKETRFLSEPWFALTSDEGRMHLLTVTPAAFKKRNVFIPADSFSVV